jgi:hypothetical protein
VSMMRSEPSPKQRLVVEWWFGVMTLVSLLQARHLIAPRLFSSHWRPTETDAHRFLFVLLMSAAMLCVLARRWQPFVILAIASQVVRAYGDAYPLVVHVPSWLSHWADGWRMASLAIRLTDLAAAVLVGSYLLRQFLRVMPCPSARDHRRFRSMMSAASVMALVQAWHTSKNPDIYRFHSDFWDLAHAQLLLACALLIAGGVLAWSSRWNLAVLAGIGGLVIYSFPSMYWSALFCFPLAGPKYYWPDACWHLAQASFAAGIAGYLTWRYVRAPEQRPQRNDDPLREPRASGEP